MSQSPYTHSCTEHPRLPCPACCWAEEHQPDFSTVRAVAEHIAPEPWQCLCVCRKLEKLTQPAHGCGRHP